MSNATALHCGNHVPTLGEPAPIFYGRALVGSNFRDIKLSDFIGKYLILFFYPMDFTPVCQSEVKDFKTRDKDGPGPIKFPMLSDQNLSVSRAYGVLQEREGVAFRSVHSPYMNGWNEKDQIHSMSLFIIDRAGKLRHVTLNDMSQERSTAEALRIVQGMKYRESKEGGGCMLKSNWKPGDPGTKPPGDPGNKTPAAATRRMKVETTPLSSMPHNQNYLRGNAGVNPFSSD